MGARLPAVTTLAACLLPGAREVVVVGGGVVGALHRVRPRRSRSWTCRWWSAAAWAAVVVEGGGRRTRVLLDPVNVAPGKPAWCCSATSARGRRRDRPGPLRDCSCSIMPEQVEVGHAAEAQNSSGCGRASSTPPRGHRSPSLGRRRARRAAGRRTTAPGRRRPWCRRTPPAPRRRTARGVLRPSPPRRGRRGAAGDAALGRGRRRRRDRHVVVAAGAWSESSATCSASTRRYVAAAGDRRHWWSPSWPPSVPQAMTIDAGTPSTSTARAGHPLRVE